MKTLQDMQEQHSLPATTAILWKVFQLFCVKTFQLRELIKYLFEVLPAILCQMHSFSSSSTMIRDCYEPNSSLVIPTQSLPGAWTSYCCPDDDKDDADECFFHRNLLNEFS